MFAGVVVEIFLFGKGIVFLNCCSDGVYGLHDYACDFYIGKFKAEIFLQGDHQLQRINRIQSQTVRAEQRLVVPNLRRTDFEHAVFNHHLFDLGLKFS
jgi:hypothetical protein